LNPFGLRLKARIESLIETSPDEPDENSVGLMEQSSELRIFTSHGETEPN